jgi:hypothetical protein
VETWGPEPILPRAGAPRPTPCAIFPKSKIQNQKLTPTGTVVRDHDPPIGDFFPKAESDLT